MEDSPKSLDSPKIEEIVIESGDSRDKNGHKLDPNPIKLKEETKRKVIGDSKRIVKEVQKKDDPRDRLDRGPTHSKEFSSSCRPSFPANSKTTSPGREAFDLPIILVPGLHSRGELVLENFVQMFAHGK